MIYRADNQDHVRATPAKWAIPGGAIPRPHGQARTFGRGAFQTARSSLHL